MLSDCLARCKLFGMASASIESMPRPRPFLLLIAAASVVPALLSALTTYLNSLFTRRGGADWVGAIFAGVLWLFFGGFTPLMYALARRFPLQRQGLVRAALAH